MSGNPKFSIVIETVNMQEHEYEEEDGAEYFEESLKEVLLQAPDLGNPEIMVVDVTTPPMDRHVKKVMKKYPQVKLVKRESLDYFACKNFGFEQSKGDVVIFFDSDCVWQPGFARAVKETFKKKHVKMCGGFTHYPLHLLGKAHTIVDFYPFPRFGKIGANVANNITVRRDIFNNFKFREGLLRTRVAISLFSWWTRNAGVLYGNPRMEQIHRYHHKWIERRFQVGHDVVSVRQREPNYPKARLLQITGILFPFIWYLPRVFMDWKRVIQTRKLLKVKWVEVPAIYTIIASARLFEVFGMLITLVYPEYFQRKYKA